jgi:gliding motility-associated-like protein
MKTIVKLALGIIATILFLSPGAHAQVQGASVFPSQPNCQGSPIFFTYSSGYTGGVTRYEWNFGDQSPLLVVNNFADSIVQHSFALPGVYQVSLTVFFGVPEQSATFDLPVFVHALPTADFKAVGTCLDSTAVFTHLSFSNDSNTISGFYWEFGDGSGDMVPNPKHYYPYPGVFNARLTVETSAGCRSTSPSKPVNVYRLPDAQIQTPVSYLCEGGTVRLEVSPYYDNYLWSTSTMDTTHYYDVPSDLPPGVHEFLVNIYEVHLEDFKVCFSKDSIEIAIERIPDDLVIAVQNLTTDLEITTQPIVAVGDSIQLMVTSQGFVLNQIEWFPPQLLDNPFVFNPSGVVNSNTRFMVQVTDNYGCKAKAEVLVQIDEEELFYTSNIVTPNGDGYNDTWIVGDEDSFLDVSFEVIIYSRWGEEVLNQKGYQNDWNGVFSNRELPEGAYYFLIRGNGTSYTGSITLVR